MRAIVLAAASSILLSAAPAAWAQVNTGAEAYRAINGETTTSYGASGSSAATGGRSGESGFFESLFGNAQIITPNDPTYSYAEPPHAGQVREWEYNGDDHGRGTSYPQIMGRDGGS
jgi:hypothetical protein